MSDFPSLVALFTRAWIEIDFGDYSKPGKPVALFTRAWIEIKYFLYLPYIGFVALFTRAWIEIIAEEKQSVKAGSRPLHEGVD